MSKELAEACRLQIKQAPDPSVIPWAPLPVFDSEAIRRQKEAEAAAERRKQQEAASASVPQEKKVIGTAATRNFFANLNAGREKQATPPAPSVPAEPAAISEPTSRQESKPPSFPFALHKNEPADTSEQDTPASAPADSAADGKTAFQNLLHKQSGQTSLFSGSRSSSSSFGSVSSGRSKSDKSSDKSEKNEKKRSGSSNDLISRLKAEFIHND